MTYASTAQEILAMQPRSDRHRELVTRSDDLLGRLETLNLGHYGALQVYSDLDDCRLTRSLTQAVNALLVEVGLATRQLGTTREAMDAVFDAQDVLFGHPADDDDGQREVFE